MVKLKNNKIIDTTVEQILNDLRFSLNTYNIPRLRDMKDAGDNIMITCPVHKEGQEQRPSCGVRKSDGFMHCFTCDSTMTLEQMISYCFGYTTDDGNYGLNWLLENYDNAILVKRDIPIGEKRKEIDRKFEFVSEEILDTYRYIHPYMYQRKLTDEVIEMFDVGYDHESKCITFPVNDMFGRCLFIARRSVEGKFFNYPRDAEKPVYGLDKVLRDGVKEVIVCESFFNALTCYVYGKPAVALMGTGAREQYEILKKSGIRKYILAFDGDEAGDKGRDRFINKLRDYASIEYYEVPRGKDINDLSKIEFENLVKKSIN